MISEMFALPAEGHSQLQVCVSDGLRRRAGITPRLSLNTTVHEERFAETVLPRMDAYDQRRAATRPYRNQREHRTFRPQRILRLVGRQGTAICRAAARRLRRVRTAPKSFNLD